MAKYGFYLYNENGKDITESNETALVDFFRSIGLATESDLTLDDIFSKDLTWNSHRSDMVSLSYLYPTGIFALLCEEKEKERSWRGFYQNGYIDYCPILFGYEYPKTEFGAIVYNNFGNWY